MTKSFKTGGTSISVRVFLFPIILIDTKLYWSLRWISVYLWNMYGPQLSSMLLIGNCIVIK